MRNRLALLVATLGVVASLAVLTPAWAHLFQGQQAPPSPPAQQSEKEQKEKMEKEKMAKMPPPNPAVAQSLRTIVKAKADMAVQGSYACCIRPGCNFCPLAADKCPCRSNVKTAIGVCGDCKAGWDAGVGSIEDVLPESVQQIKGDMLKMMYSMRGPREQMVAPTTVAGGHQH